jgi:hypothetical protein
MGKTVAQKPENGKQKMENGAEQLPHSPGTLILDFRPSADILFRSCTT